MAEKGILLFAVGDKTYLYWAYNQALSIKYHSPDLPIQILTEKGYFDQLQSHHRKFFDIVTYLPEHEIYETRKIRPRQIVEKVAPAKIKTRLIQWSEFDKTIYLDVDGLTTKPLEPLFELCKDGEYYAQWAGKGKKGEDWGQMIWAHSNDIYDHYKLPPDCTMRFINSSFQYFKKNTIAEKVFEQAYQNLQNPIPITGLRNPWGNSQPDELYMNIAFAQLGISPRLDACYRPILFTLNSVHPGDINKEVGNYYGLGLWGDKRTNHGHAITLYDKLLKNYCKFGYEMGVEYKSSSLLDRKFVLSK